jgi:ABC-type glycerol-3-phosphate transport system substrate-binding protein
MNPRATLFSATLLCLATALAACGGSSPSSFATSATQVCTAYYNEAGPDKQTKRPDRYA